MQEMTPKRFSAALPFDRLLPFEPLFFERVPLILACQLALANFRANRKRDAVDPDSQAARLRQSSRNNMFWSVECGVFSGSALLATARTIQDFGIDFMLVGLDTFAGLPALAGRDLELAPEDAPYRSKVLFTETSIGAVQAKVNDAGLRDSVWLLEGLFSATLPLLPADHTYHFVNIDCDLYEPHIECLEYFYPRMEPGGVIFFDDYDSVAFPMARRAIDDFMQGKKETLAFLQYGPEHTNHRKAFLVKY
jgi:hypothetical protein